MGPYTEIYNQINSIRTRCTYEKLSTKKFIELIEEIDFTKIEQSEKLKYFLHLFEKEKKFTLSDKLNPFDRKKYRIDDLVCQMKFEICRYADREYYEKGVKENNHNIYKKIELKIANKR